MRLRRVRVENFRSYRNPVAIENVSDICVLIGRNNAGKSNFIKALDWYRGMAQGNETSPRILHTGNNEKPLVFEIEFEFDEAERNAVLSVLPFKTEEISKSMRESKFMTRLRHRLEFGTMGNLRREDISFPNASDDWFSGWGCGNNRGVQTQFWQDDLRGEILDMSKPVDLGKRINTHGGYGERRRGFVWAGLDVPFAEADRILRDYLRRMLWITPIRSAAPSIKPQQDTMISASGDNLLRVLNTLSGEDSDRYEALMKEVYAIIPELKRIRSPLRGNDVVAIISEPGNVEIGMDEAGSGLQQTLILIMNLLLRPENSLVLVEEPEINLNASAQRALFRLMKRLLERNHQFIITTHSTIFTETSARVATFLLDKKDGASSIRRLGEPEELRFLKQALGHENTDLFGFNAVLIVEGEAEEKALPLLAAANEMDLVRLGVRVINIGGTGTTTRIEELLEYVQHSDTVSFLMLDHHSPAVTSKEKWIDRKLVEEKNIIILEKEFEDCFDDETLANALKILAADHGSDISISAQDVGNYRKSGKGVSHYLENVYYDRTKHSLSKPELGVWIAKLLIRTGKREKLTPPEEVLLTIKERLNLRQ